MTFHGVLHTCRQSVPMQDSARKLLPGPYLSDMECLSCFKSELSSHFSMRATMSRCCRPAWVTFFCYLSCYSIIWQVGRTCTALEFSHFGHNFGTAGLNQLNVSYRRATPLLFLLVYYLIQKSQNGEGLRCMQ